MSAIKKVIILQFILVLFGCEISPFEDQLKSEQRGQFEIEWEPPVERENGEKLFPYEIGGYEVAYRYIDNDHFKTKVIRDPDAKSALIQSEHLGQYEVKISAFDTNGLYSSYSESIITTALK